MEVVIQLLLAADSPVSGHRPSRMLPWMTSTTHYWMMKILDEDVEHAVFRTSLDEVAYRQCNEIRVDWAPDEVESEKRLWVVRFC